MPDEAMSELEKQHLAGPLPDDIWKALVQGFCKSKVGSASNIGPTLSSHVHRLCQLTPTIADGHYCLASYEANMHLFTVFE